MVTGNHIVGNMLGIVLGYGTEPNIIVDNNITGNSIAGIRNWKTSNNIFYRNNFVNNTNHVEDAAVTWPTFVKIKSLNTWDNGTVGNFWSDYNGTDTDGDGVGDTPYIIDENNQDNYPLIAPCRETEQQPSTEPSPEPCSTAVIVDAS